MSEIVPIAASEATGIGDALASQLALEMDGELFTAAIDQASVDRAMIPEATPPSSSDYPLETDESVRAEPGGGMATQLWSAFVNVDTGYHAIFPLGESANGSPSFRTGDPQTVTQASEHGGADAPDLARLMEQSLEVSLWSVQVNLLTSGVKRSTDGVQTLFRNSG